MPERSLAFARQQILLKYPDRTGSTINFLFRDVPQGTGEPEYVTIEVREIDRPVEFVLFRDGSKVGAAPCLPQLANLVMGECIYSLVHGIASGIALHAGAVARHGKGVWLPGRTGAGKSTLTAWFLSRGFDYLTDELVHIDEAGVSFSSFTRPLNIKQGSAAIVTNLTDEDSRLERILKSDSVTMIPSELFGARSARQNTEVSLIVFPSFEKGAALSIEPLSAAQAGLHLFACHVNARNLPDHGFHLVSRIARRVPACLLRYGDLGQLDEFLAELVEITLEWELDRPRFEQLSKTFMTVRSRRVRAHDTSSDALDHDGVSIPEATPRAEKRKLTIGMATYDDYDGVYFSIQAIRLFHPEILGDCEILVIDNHPEGPCSRALKRLEESISNYRYIPYQGVRSTVVRDFVFQEANSEYVLCIDSHVLIYPGAVKKLIRYLDENPNCRDLLQGPMLYDDMTNMTTHFEPQWSKGMYGTWGFDERGRNPDADPFEIPMQGCGLFACRKDAWPGFNLSFRGFGGEEGYIHEKFRQAGGRTICLPFLRWLHRFERPTGVPYQVKWEDRIRNYLIGFTELGLDTTQIIEHFQQYLGEEAAMEIISTVNQEMLRASISDSPGLSRQRY